MLIYKGAEAEVYKEKFLGIDAIRKVRKEKKYKQPALDARLRRERLKNEVRMLAKARQAVNTPHVLFVGEDTIVMEYVNGDKCKDLFLKKDISPAKRIGKAVRAMHDAGIVHNDLTTSNIIVNDKIWLIDFGLAAQSTALEDKAVDLVVFKRMLSSTHYDVFEKVWPQMLEAYDANAALLKKMNEVESRSKYKAKGGF